MSQLLQPKHFSKFVILGLCSIFGVIIFLVSMNYGMFWDNVLFASKMGNHLYENDILNWNIPNSFDPGHPPFLGFLLAITWGILGQSLWASHLLMLPFTVGILYQLHKLIFLFTKSSRNSLFGVLLILCDPTFSATLVLVNPETIILFFFFLAVNGVFYQQNKWKFIGLFFLSIVSFRSMMLFAGIFLFDVFNQKYIYRKSFTRIFNKNLILLYFLSSIPAVIFISWRLITKGWLQTHPDSPWSSLWRFPSFKEALTNIVVLFWRYLDYGRIFILFFLVIGLFYLWNKANIPSVIKQLFVLSITSVFFVILASIFSTNAFGHRYFTASYILLILCSFLILCKLSNYKRLIYLALLIGLITGNLWIYPEKVSQGWDATLAHIPYHSLRTQGIKFLEEEKINLEEVGTFFPNYNSQNQITLNGDSRTMDHFDNSSNYVFYSNVYNLNNDELKNLRNNYLEIKRFSSFQIYISILKRKSK